mmetsp:Transcript_20678/g.26765  ORF Transcript_20678/g.26765 Transcript_20678/m.26765 type:complete len:115 (-) Transcript_20678:146-490(-)
MKLGTKSALILALVVAYIQAFSPTTTVRQTTTIVQGRYDKRTRKGKIYAGSFGNSRKRINKGNRDVVDPYSTLREWGKRQDPPMTVEQVIEAKVNSKIKQKLSGEELMATLVPI